MVGVGFRKTGGVGGFVPLKDPRFPRASLLTARRVYCVGSAFVYVLRVLPPAFIAGGLRRWWCGWYSRFCLPPFLTDP